MANSDRMGAAVDRLLEQARDGISPRVTVAGLATEIRQGALVVDIRPVAQRERDGHLEGAVVVERNVLEWRLDPTSPFRLEGVDGPDRRIIIVCDAGYASSLAAASLAGLGLTRVTDLDGGYQAWLRYRADSSSGS